MVLDSILSADKYYTLHPRFKEAFEYIKNNMHSLEVGKYIIEENEVFVMISQGELKAKENAFLEAHIDYIDIQVVIEGHESHGWSHVKDCKKIKTSYNEQKDIIFYNDTPSTYINVDKDEFVIFFPNDVHAPMVGEGIIKKAVIKVRVC